MEQTDPVTGHESGLVAIVADSATFESAPACRCCGSMRSGSQGKLPDVGLFAGNQLSIPLNGGTLYRCLDCGFVFRHPIYDKDTYDRLYEAGDSDTWDDEDRRDRELVREELLALVEAGGSVLDVGCGSGKLLMPLVGHFTAYGVEINRAAATMAQSRGIDIVAHDLKEVAEVARLFDAVVSCDVIEHVSYPFEFVRLLLSKTTQGGVIVISSANADAWSWRIFGSRFWYCYPPEHISFVSPAWFDHYAPALGAQILTIRQFVYSPERSLAAKSIRLLLMVLFRMSPVLYYRLLPNSKRNNIPVGRGITRDHFVVVLRKCQ